jgi:triosephosphate isomerase
MNGLRQNLSEIAAICASVGAGDAGQAEIVICPPATLLMAAAPICEGSPVALGGQDCHIEASGPFTGEISAEMLKDAGAAYVILGHSERRLDHYEYDHLIQEKTKAAFRAGLTAIVCIGETRAEREAGEALPVIAAQLAGSIPGHSAPERLVIAYEPVWAIGTGLTPTLHEIAEMHRFIRLRLDQLLPGQGVRIRILYGGSVKPGNAGEIMAVEGVDGALVGGASLTSADFMTIAAVYGAKDETGSTPKRA